MVAAEERWHDFTHRYEAETIEELKALVAARVLSSPDAPADPPAAGDFPAVAMPLPADHPARSAGRVGDSPPAARPHFTPPTPRE